MSLLTIPSASLYTEFDQNVDIIGSTGGGLYVRGADFVATGMTNLAQTYISTTGASGMTVVGSGTITFNISAAMSMTAGATSVHTTTAGTMTVSSSDATSAGGVLISSAGSLAGGSAVLQSTNASAGFVALKSNGGVANAISLQATGTLSGILAQATGVVSIQTSSVASGILVGTTTAGVPITIGSSTSAVAVPGNLTVTGNAVITGNFTVNGATTYVNSTTLDIQDNMILLNSGPTSAVGKDSGVMVRRFQTPNNTGAGDVVNGFLQESGTTSAGGSTTTMVLATTASAVDGSYVDWWVLLPSTTQARKVKSYVGATKTITIYGTADNTATFLDGLDFTGTVATATAYKLYNASNASTVFSNANNLFSFQTSALNDAITPLSTITSSQNYSSIAAQQLTSNPLVFNNCAMSITSTTLTVTVPTTSYLPVVGEKILLSNLTNFTVAPSVVVAYTVVSATAGSFTVTVATGTTTATSAGSVTYMNSSVLNANVINVTNPLFGTPLITGFNMKTELVTITGASTASFNITNTSTSGAYLIIVHDNASAAGASLIMAATSTGVTNTPAVVSRVQGTITDNPLLQATWTTGNKVQINHKSAVTAARTYAVTVMF